MNAAELFKSAKAIDSTIERDVATANELWRNAESILDKACTNAKKFSDYQVKAENALGTCKAQFEKLADQLHENNWLVEWFDWSGTYSDIGLMVAESIAERLYPADKFTLFSMSDSSLEALTKEQRVERARLRRNVRSTHIEYMVQRFNYHEQCSEMREDHAVYEADWSERLESDTSLAKSEPFQPCGEGRWSDAPENVAQYVSAKRRSESNGLNLAVDLVRSLAFCADNIDAEDSFTGDLQLPMETEVITKFRDSLTTCALTITECLIGAGVDYQGNKAYTNALESIGTVVRSK